MNKPAVVMMSLWRNDARRQLVRRAWHLLDKSYPNLRFVWVVGDSQDQTIDMLRRIQATSQRDIQLLEVRTDIDDRLTRLSVTANYGLECVRDTDDYLVIHESDLVSPRNLIEQFVAHAHAGRCPIAGWPILNRPGHAPIFYDILAYSKDGRHFENEPPYHPCYRPHAPFEVDSVGSCWMLPAEPIRDGVRMQNYATLDLSAALRNRNYKIWVDAQISIEQPFELWTPLYHPMLERHEGP